MPASQAERLYVHDTEFSPITAEFAGFRLTEGRYAAIAPDERGWCWSTVLDLYLGVEDGWLRYFEPDGMRVLGPAEAALREREQVERERQRAEQALQQVEQERQRAENLAQRLRELGIDPD